MHFYYQKLPELLPWCFANDSIHRIMMIIMINEFPVSENEVFFFNSAHLRTFFSSPIATLRVWENPRQRNIPNIWLIKIRRWILCFICVCVISLSRVIIISSFPTQSTIFLNSLERLLFHWEIFWHHTKSLTFHSTYLLRSCTW